MKSPRWPLALVKEVAARKNRLILSRTKALAFFSSNAEAYQVARATVTALSHRDFAHTLQQNPDPCDVYGVTIGGGGWYLKLTMLTDVDGEFVFLVSLHPLQRPLRLANGREVKP